MLEFSIYSKAIRVANSSNGLALELFKRVADHDNVFFAPFAISTVLSMAYQGSAGRTAEEMAKVLGEFENFSVFHIPCKRDKAEIFGLH